MRKFIILQQLNETNHELDLLAQLIFFEGKLYIQTGKVKPVSKQIAENPKAELCAFKDGTWQYH